MSNVLTIESLCREACCFSKKMSIKDFEKMYGVTDGKAIGTFLEHEFLDYLSENYEYGRGNSAKGIDLPELMVDIKVTRNKQPQSSCPFRSARQKIFGLGYSLLIFVYDKSDNFEKRTGRLSILNTVFVDSTRTADYQITTGINQILANNGNKDDLIAFMSDKMLPADEISMNNIAEDLLKKPLKIGYLTISNALQWRLQYARVIQEAGNISGIINC